MMSLVRPVCVLVAAPFAASGLALAQSDLYEHEAFAPSFGYGFNVCAIGDLDADGVCEYIVSTLKDGGYADIFSGKTGVLIERIHGTGCFGMGLANLGDVNGDSISDFAVSAPREDSPLAFAGGLVRVYSGADLGVLYVLEGDQPHARFGIALGNAGDLDGDQIDDLVVGSWWDDFELKDMGSIDVYSGADGQHLVHARGTQEEEWFGTSVTGAGDVNGDGTPDVLVGAPFRWYNDLGFPPGSAVVVSGVDGSTLRTYSGNNGGDYFGTSVELVPDVDGDGAPDHAVGSPRHDVGGEDVGAVFVYSGLTGALITSMTGEVDSRFGTRVAAADLDGDGAPELLVSACACVNVGPDSAAIGALEIRGASDGVLLGRIEGAADIGFGYSVDSIGDVNNDGIGEFVYGNHWDDVMGEQTGSARVTSYADLPLTENGHLASLAAGVNIQLDIDFGPTYGGRGYWVIGSLSGTSPGVTAGAVHVDLNFDSYTSAMIQYPNTHQFDNTFGLLDGAGEAAASIVVPAGAIDPSFIGVTVWHAVGVFTGAEFLTASQTVPTTLEP